MTLKLLLVGKEIANFQAIKDAFNNENEDVVIITATSMALALFLARKNQPDLIISQEELVDGSGLDFIYELKNEDELANIPILFIKDKIDMLKENVSSLKERILAQVIHRA